MVSLIKNTFPTLHYNHLLCCIWHVRSLLIFWKISFLVVHLHTLVLHLFFYRFPFCLRFLFSFTCRFHCQAFSSEPSLSFASDLSSIYKQPRWDLNLIDSFERLIFLPLPSWVLQPIVLRVTSKWLLILRHYSF